VLTFRALPTAAELIASAARSATPTEARRDVMLELRARGLSLRAVGRIFGVHHHSIAHALRNQLPEKPCACCGALFAPKSRSQKFHSIKCKWKCAKKTKWKPKPDVEVTRECMQCGDQFTKLRSSRVRKCDPCRRNVRMVIPKTEKKALSAFSIGWMPEGI
jgi:hypothetical protein